MSSRLGVGTLGQRLNTRKKLIIAKKSRNSLGTRIGFTVERPRARKRFMNYGTWNVQGSRGKMLEIVSELETMKMDIVTLTETKKKGHGTNAVGKYFHIFSGVPKEQRAKRGVSILVHSKYKKNIRNWEYVNENIITLNLTSGAGESPLWQYIHLQMMNKRK